MKRFDISECEDLFKVITGINSIEDCKKFFEDVCTFKEMQDISQRLEVAKLLSEKYSYQDVSKETGASATTISRVNKCLTYGKGGYEVALKILKDEK